MKPFISMRLGEGQQSNIDSLKSFIDLFKKYPRSCDEVWFSTYYGYPTLEKHKIMAENIEKAATLVRENGIAASLQISNTIGHSSISNTSDRTGFVWDSFVGYDGVTSAYCSCPRDSRFLDYIYETTKYYSKFLPDFVWIDDDIRMSNHSPADFGCFCPRCVDLFNKKTNKSYSRDQLIAEINTDLEIRDTFIKFNQRSLAGVVKAVADAVGVYSSDSSIGIQMTTYPSTTYNGDNFDYLMEKIKEYTGKPAAIRPGGGFYDDHSPRDVFKKGLKLSSATDRTPDDVVISQAEIENIPHTFTGKSSKGTLIESAVYLAYGCTSLSYSAFMTQNEPTEYYEKLFSMLSLWGDFLREYQSHNANTINGGAGIIFSKTHNKKPGFDKTPFDWTGYKGDDLYKMQEYGVPLSWDNKHNPVRLLHFSEVDALSDNELYKVFSNGVITDAQTVKKLNERGLSDILSLEVSEFDIMDCCEKVSDHPLNDKYSGQIWHNYYTTKSTARPMLLNPKNKLSEILGYFIKRYDQSVLCGPSSVILPSSCGGKTAVFSYNPWSSHVNSARWNQLQSCLDLLGDKKMSIRMKNPSQTVVIPRISRQGSLRSVMLINISLDTLLSPEIYLRVPKSASLSFIRPEKPDMVLDPICTPSGSLVTLPSLDPWDLGYIKAIY